MLPNIVKGHSFKGVTEYLMHDKNQDAKAPVKTSDRVGFFHVLNFIGDEARDPFEAAKIMALTVRDKDYLKDAAGVGKGGRKAEKPPVWHTSLAWHPSETVDEAEMMRAVDGCLKAVGLGLDKGYQTYVVQHTDEPQPHVHVVVNLVHPVNGKQANPNNDQIKAQAWGRRYDKARGTIFCHDREAKYAAIDAARANGPTSVIFNDRAQGGTGTAGKAAPARPQKGQKRAEWEARQARQKEAQDTAERIKAANDARYSAMRAKHDAAYQGRQREYEQSRADRAAFKNAIYEKYKTALDAVWNPRPGPKEASPDREIWNRLNGHLAKRKADFERREQTVLGRLANALTLLPRKAGIMGVVRLALSDAERRRLFERSQRRLMAKFAPPHRESSRDRPRPATPEPKRVQAERLKAMRTIELAEHARKAAAAAASMNARHQFQREAEQAERAAFAKEAKAAWAAHSREFPRERQAETVPPPQRQPDRFGRSRDRKPRAARQGRAGGRANGNAAGRPVDAFEDAAVHTAPEQREAAQRPPTGLGDDVQRGGAMSPDERSARIEAERQAREAREREEERTLDPGRGMGR